MKMQTALQPVQKSRWHGRQSTPRSILDFEEPDQDSRDEIHPKTDFVTSHGPDMNLVLLEQSATALCSLLIHCIYYSKRFRGHYRYWWSPQTLMRQGITLTRIMIPLPMSDAMYSTVTSLHESTVSRIPRLNEIYESWTPHAAVLPRAFHGAECARTWFAAECYSMSIAQYQALSPSRSRTKAVSWKKLFLRPQKC